MRQYSEILGVKVDRLSTDQVLDRISEFVASAKPHHVVYVNVDGINRFFSDKRYCKIVNEADLVYPDGMGVVWASKFSDKPLSERVNAGDFLPDLCKVCVEKGYKIYLLGSEKGVAEGASDYLQKKHKGLKIVGTGDGFFDDKDEEKIIKEINKLSPDILLVGMGVPRQEKWIKRNMRRLNVPVCWGVGALFDFYSLRIKRAPIIMRKIGLEWLFRLMIEPRRLWRRYIIGNFLFTLRLFTLLALDAFLISVGWIGAYWIRYLLNDSLNNPINPFSIYLYALPGIVGLWILMCIFFDLYRQRPRMDRFEEFSIIVKAVLMGILSTMSFSFMFKEFDFGRLVVLISGMLNLFLLIFSRNLITSVDRILERKEYGLKKALIVGTGEFAQQIKKEIEDMPAGYNVVSFIGLDHVADLEKVVDKHEIDEIFIAAPDMPLKEKLNLVSSHKELDVEFKIISDAFRLFAKRIKLDKIMDIPVVDISSSEEDRFYLIIKSVADFLLAFIGILLFLPFGFIIAIFIKFESRGPIFFWQDRVGKDFQIFKMLKFRTMHHEVDEYELSPNDLNDPRVTPIGRFLRRWSLDELPQLFNVLKGDMSLVGPRPEMVFLVEKYESWQKERLLVKPGITGLWQIAGRKNLPLHKNIEYDFYYIKHRSLVLDFLILLKTIPAVLKRHGAY